MPCLPHLVRAGCGATLYDEYEVTKAKTAENKEEERKGSPVCVYGDMELQQRAFVDDFMSGPLLGVNKIKADEAKKPEDLDKGILEYLLGFTPTITSDIENAKAQKTHKVPTPAKKPKVNSRDAKLHFLMGRYNSGQGLFAHDELAREVRHRMALDTAFFSLFPDIYQVDGTHHTPDGALHVPKDFDCLRFLVETFENKCMPFNEYGLGHVKYLVEFCETKKTNDIVEKAMNMGDVCKNLIV